MGDYMITSHSSRGGPAKTSETASLAQTGMDTNSARETAMTLIRNNLRYDYINSSKEDLVSYQNTNTGRTSRHSDNTRDTTANTSTNVMR